eukprot:SAG31_NODE_19030_length_614_cov_0.693204_2_plen_119_part_01
MLHCTRFSWFPALATLAATALVSAATAEEAMQSNVIVLNDSNFDSKTSGVDSTILVFAYKQDDPFSAQLMPHMEEAAELLRQKGHSGAISKLDGPNNKLACSKINVGIFPKIKLYVAGK